MSVKPVGQWAETVAGFGHGSPNRRPQSWRRWWEAVSGQSLRRHHFDLYPRGDVARKDERPLRWPEGGRRAARDAHLDRRFGRCGFDDDPPHVRVDTNRDPPRVGPDDQCLARSAGDHVGSAHVGKRHPVVRPDAVDEFSGGIEHFGPAGQIPVVEVKKNRKVQVRAEDEVLLVAHQSIARQDGQARERLSGLPSAEDGFGVVGIVADSPARLLAQGVEPETKESGQHEPAALFMWRAHDPRDAQARLPLQALAAADGLRGDGQRRRLTANAGQLVPFMVVAVDRQRDLSCVSGEEGARRWVHEAIVDGSAGDGHVVAATRGMRHEAAKVDVAVGQGVEVGVVDDEAGARWRIGPGPLRGDLAQKVHEWQQTDERSGSETRAQWLVHFQLGGGERGEVATRQPGVLGSDPYRAVRRGREHTRGERWTQDRCGVGLAIRQDPTPQASIQQRVNREPDFAAVWTFDVTALEPQRGTWWALGWRRRGHENGGIEASEVALLTALEPNGKGEL